MKNKRHSDAQIMGILKQAESGVSVSELCRAHSVSRASFTIGERSLAGWMRQPDHRVARQAEDN